MPGASAGTAAVLLPAVTPASPHCTTAAAASTTHRGPLLNTPSSHPGRPPNQVSLLRPLTWHSSDPLPPSPGVFISSLKLVAFHGTFTWLTFRMFAVPLAYTATVACAACALLPFIPTYVIALPACAMFVAQVWGALPACWPRARGWGWELGCGKGI